jgi:hypothetical protein
MTRTGAKEGKCESGVLPTPGGRTHHLAAAPGTHEKKRKTPDVFNPSQNAII